MKEEELKIRKAYRKSKNIYDDVLTQSKLMFKAYNKIVWAIKDEDYVGKLLSFIPDDFNGKVLDVPVGTAVFTYKKYLKMTDADIIALDYSNDMLMQAQQRFLDLEIRNITCMSGDVGDLPFEKGRFDLVLSMNGIHAFPNKNKAFNEIFRVLKKGVFNSS